MENSARACPRCKGAEFHEIEDDYGEIEDEYVAYISHVCAECGLMYDSWSDRWVDESELSEMLGGDA